MTLNEYQDAASKTAIYPTDTFNGEIYCALKLNGEAGEVAELVAKYRLRCDDIQDYKNKLIKELGDVLWYVANLAKELNISLDTLAQVNLDKLRDRAARGVIKGSGSDR